MVTNHLTEGEQKVKRPRHKQRVGPGDTRAAPASESGAILWLEAEKKGGNTAIVCPCAGPAVWPHFFHCFHRRLSVSETMLFDRQPMGGCSPCTCCFLYRLLGRCVHFLLLACCYVLGVWLFLMATQHWLGLSAVKSHYICNYSRWVILGEDSGIILKICARRKSMFQLAPSQW